MRFLIIWSSSCFLLGLITGLGINRIIAVLTQGVSRALGLLWIGGVFRRRPKQVVEETPASA